MQLPAEVLQLDERRQLAAPRRLELARVLAQLGRDEVVAEVPVQLLLAPRLHELPRLRVLDAVLRDAQTLPDGRLAERHVVLLRAREMLEQVPVGLGRDHP